MAGPGHDPKGPQKIQEGLVKAEQRSFPFSDGSGHVIDYQFGADALEKNKGIQQGLVQGLLLLGVSELPIQ